MNNLKEDDIVLCTVKKIEGTSVFLEIDGDGTASMIMSEVAAGRIRNLREYVFPNKKVVCKVLKISSDGHIELSLRRVTGKERETAMANYKKEITFSNMIKTITKNPQKIIEEIKKKYEICEFFDEIQSNPKLLEEFLAKEEAIRLATLLSEKEEREKQSKKIFILQSQSGTGVYDIKKILEIKGVDIRYLGSSKFSIAVKGSDFKETNAMLDTVLVAIEKHAKENKVHFELKEK